MWKTIGYFFKKVCVNTYLLLSPFLILPLNAYNAHVKPRLPLQYQWELPTLTLVSLIFFFLLLRMTIKAFHELRMLRLQELYDNMPEANEDRIFRVLYGLYKEGEFLKKAGIERRQEWDERVYKEILKSCKNNFTNNYLLGTGRKYGQYSSISNNYYDKAVSLLKECIDR